LPQALKARAAHYIIVRGNTIEINDVKQRLTELERAAEENKHSR
jgi:hypothetical protein